MPNSFSGQIVFDKKTLLATIVPQMQQNGMHYEVNIKGYPRFFMAWSPIYRFDLVVDKELNIPYELVLAVSDLLEKQVGAQVRAED